MEKAKNATRLIFWIELILVIFIPFIGWWSMTPTNILNSNFWFGLLEIVGISGSGLFFCTGIPVGVLGIVKAKKLENLRIPTIILSVINLSVGVIEVGMLISIFCMVVFGGLSV